MEKIRVYMVAEALPGHYAELVKLWNEPNNELAENFFNLLAEPHMLHSH